MVGKKRWLFFKKLKLRKESLTWRFKFLGSAFKGKRVDLQVSFMDNVVFKVVSVLEAIVLVLSLSFFYCFCGCHF